MHEATSAWSTVANLAVSISVKRTQDGDRYVTVVLKVNFGQVLMNIQPLVAGLPSVCDCQSKPKKILTSASHEYGGSQSQIQSGPDTLPEPIHMKFALCCPFIFYLGVFAFARLSSTTAHQQQEAQRQSSGETGQAQV